ncbi:LysR family transcriptional regulator [Pseudooceanicola sp. CBS1P-1]|uniref:LysR family transcriptional regulator n=1 Tax=Pseudooceanicola albus TaxID=2692189 RepID=A0A6L7GE04_9RHOB|nr:MULTISPECIES: LysR family transcriptional regulator [Pseudooceanicola]MBT9386753.1 LysR family transcriptional regulator [Pseudooceanicola endophyticus]MXN20983.1 LysR family transcriptional regulator [Pseudooceanicola albus]
MRKLNNFKKHLRKEQPLNGCIAKGPSLHLNQKSLEALRAFVETGSISGAADRLLRTPPQVSRLLSALEQQVGFAVLVKRGRRLHLTREGKELYYEVERVMQAQDVVERRADQIRRGRKEHLRLLVAPFISNAVINQALATVMERHPRMTAQIDARVRLDIDIWVTQETFDLGVAPLPIREGAFEVEPFLELPMMVAMHPDHPLAARKVVTFEEFAAHPIVATHARSLLGQHLEMLCQQTGKRLDVRVEARNGVIACQMAGLNIGCCLTDPFVALSSGVEDIVLRPFAPQGLLRYAFLFPSWGTRSPVVEEVALEIRRNSKALAAEIFQG